MTTDFASLGLAEPLLRALRAENYAQPTPIQAQAIPHLMNGRDLLGIAQTGTGKTAAFALPILHRLAAERTGLAPRHARALVLAPTRELAVQIGDSFRTYGRLLNLKHAVVFGGVGYHHQIQAMARGVDVLVATPGRLIDLIQDGHVRLEKTAIFVLDEGDRMLDMGFIQPVRRIAKLLPKTRQTLLFSATMPDEIARLAGELLHRPERVEVTPKVVTVDRIEQSVRFADSNAKRGLLVQILRDPALTRVIVFTRTKHGADKVVRHLGHSGIAAEAIHGNKSQNARQRALLNFRNGKVRVLVATDIAARGIDVDGITHVVNYELPNVPESYVHRIGRTARAGAGGAAIAFCAPDEREYLRDIEKLIGRRLQVVTAGGPAPHRQHTERSAVQHQNRGSDRPARLDSAATAVYA